MRENLVNMDEELPTDTIELEPDLPPGVVPEDDAPTTRTIRRSAVAQGSEIPQGWKPTVQAPVPVVRCHYVWREGHPRAGERCGRWSLRGSRNCYKHSGHGNLKNVEEHRLAILDAARLELTGSVPDAVEWLLDLAANGNAEAIRLKAITEIMDRGGLKVAQESNVNVTVNDTSSPLNTLSERLQKLKDAAVAVEELKQKAQADTERLALEATRGDEDIIDAEVVEDP